MRRGFFPAWSLTRERSIDVAPAAGRVGPSCPARGTRRCPAELPHGCAIALVQRRGSPTSSRFRAARAAWSASPPRSCSTTTISTRATISPSCCACSRRTARCRAIFFSRRRITATRESFALARLIGHPGVRLAALLALLGLRDVSRLLLRPLRADPAAAARAGPVQPRVRRLDRGALSPRRPAQRDDPLSLRRDAPPGAAAAQSARPPRRTSSSPRGSSRRIRNCPAGKNSRSASILRIMSADCPPADGCASPAN